MLYNSVNSEIHYQHFLYFAFPKWWLAFVSWSFKHAAVEVAVCLLTVHGPYHHPVWKLLLHCFGLAACQSYPASHPVSAWIAETERLRYFNKWPWNGDLCIVRYLKLSTICTEFQVSVSGFAFCFFSIANLNLKYYKQQIISKWSGSATVFFFWKLPTLSFICALTKMNFYVVLNAPTDCLKIAAWNVFWCYTDV